MPQYEWYQWVDHNDDISQGDVIRDLSIPVFSPTKREPYFQALKSDPLDFIVLTQACDLERRKDGSRAVNIATICHLMSLKDWCKKTLGEIYHRSVDIDNLQDEERKRLVDEIESLRKGEYVHFHLLEKEDSLDGYRVANFAVTQRIPVDTLERTCKSRTEARLRVLPPYREHLAQAYARTFMRIGLPTDIKVDYSLL